MNTIGQGLKSSMPYILGTLLGVTTGVFFLLFVLKPGFLNPIIEEDKELPLKVYSIPTLRKTAFPTADTNLKIGETVDYGDTIIARKFTFTDVVADKTVSGVITFPDTRSEYPVVLMFRGYVDQEIYRPGIGNQRTATKLSESGYITLTPDFLGYGDSDVQSNDSLEARFQTYTTALSLLSAVGGLNDSLAKEEDLAGFTANEDKIAFWGHSNGGQIAMTTLAITGAKYPTLLWAPVTKQFPESILAFADELEDGGTYLRAIVSDFQGDYNMSLYAFNNYLHWVKAPIQMHQGAKDDAVPVEWSQEFEKTLQDNGIDITYYEYPDENHNFTDGDWGLIMSRDFSFLSSKLDN